MSVLDRLPANPRSAICEVQGTGAEARNGVMRGQGLMQGERECVFQASQLLGRLLALVVLSVPGFLLRGF